LKKEELANGPKEKLSDSKSPAKSPIVYPKLE
jgi:hypothetical protein